MNLKESMEAAADDAPDNRYDEAVRLFNNGNFQAAGEILQTLLSENKNDYDVLNFLGVIKLNEKKYDLAVPQFEQVISLCPAHIDALYNIGYCYQCLKETDKALEYYQKVLELDFQHFDAILNSGIIYLHQGNHLNAESCFNYCISITPENPAVFNNIGNLNIARGKYDEAVEDYLQAVELEPVNPDYIFNLAVSWYKKNDFDAAIECFEKVLAVSEDYIEAYKYLSIVYTKKFDTGKAEECLAKYNKMLNDKVVLLTNNGIIKFRAGKIDEAIADFDEALEYNPQHDEIHFNKSHALLLLGDYETGLAEYEWRLKRADYKGKELKKPLSPGYDVNNKKILIYEEQGLGDSINFIRYIPLLKKKGAYTIFVCSKYMHPLFSGMEGLDEIISREDLNKEVSFDYDVFLLSLPLFFKTDVSSIPSDVPYIKARPEYINKWKEQLSSSNAVKAGIVWAGNPKHISDKERSVPLNEFSPIFNIEGAEIFGLQKGYGVEQLQDFEYPLKMLEQENFLDAAGAIHNLDLVITADTSVAHLAGAMGKETWLLLCYMPDWRWLLNRRDTPWYPSVKLFRQEKPGDWANVFAEVKEELINLVKEKEQGLINPVRPSAASSLFLGLTSGENFGWGVVCKYLKKELSGKIKTIDLEEHPHLAGASKLKGTVFQLLTDERFFSLYPVRGDVNIVHTAFENELNENSVRNSGEYDLILAASTWGKEKMIEAGIKNAGALIQGIDPGLFYPGEAKTNDNLFVIFSGGKFEYRKGQDLVLKAVKILQEKYDDIILINAWYNLWYEVLRNMSLSPHINFEIKGNTWNEIINHIYAINGMKANRIFTLPLVPNEKLREVYLKSDIGLFPNRCEGGTNLVMMEYMACGKPVIASFYSGHKDIVNENNAFLLTSSNEVKIYSEDRRLMADWSEPSIDEIIDKIETAYHNRELGKKLGVQAAIDMKNFTWEKTADNLLKYIKDFE